MLDFGELGGSGTGLEQLVREVLLLMDLHPQWSGVGPDGGRDLLFDEPGLAVLGKKPRRWVVSCKDKSASGASVGVDDVDPVVDVMHQHAAHGYLLVCTTQPSSAVVERLRAIEAQSAGTRAVHIWDGVTLERLLAAPRIWSVAQQFMPKSTNAAGWKIFGTEAPNRWVAVHRGHYFHLANRVGGGEKFNFGSLDRVIEEILSLDRAEMRMRLRGVWFDDAKGGGYIWYVDCMVEQGRRKPTPHDLLAKLRNGQVRRDGQFHFFEVVVREIDWGRDHFDMDHYDFYKGLPSFVDAGGR